MVNEVSLLGARPPGLGSPPAKPERGAHSPQQHQHQPPPPDGVKAPSGRKRAASAPPEEESRPTKVARDTITDGALAHALRKIKALKAQARASNEAYDSLMDKAKSYKRQVNQLTRENALLEKAETDALDRIEDLEEQMEEKRVVKLEMENEDMRGEIAKLKREINELDGQDYERAPRVCIICQSNGYSESDVEN